MTTEAKTVEQRGHRKVRKGTVVSVSGNKTIVVEAERRKRHPLYGKIERLRRKFHAHDEQCQAKVGDKVTIAETRPLSKLKCWRLVSVDVIASAIK